MTGAALIWLCPKTAPGLIEASRRLGQRLETSCTEVSLSNEEQLADAR